MVWEGGMVYATLESALQALDDALAAWMKAHYVMRNLANEFDFSPLPS